MKWTMLNGTCRRGTQVACSKSVRKLSETGPMLAKLRIEQHQEDITGTSRHPAQPHPSDVMSYMPAFQAPNRGVILNGKSVSCAPSFQITRSFLTSDQASISAAADFSPFWTDVCKELSEKSWLPTAIDLPGSGSASLNASSSVADQFSRSLKIVHATGVPKNSQKTSWQCSPTSRPSTTADARMCSRKIRIYPNAHQRAKFRQFFGAHRHFYNRAKAEVDAASDAARTQRMADLEGSWNGVCCREGCDLPVSDPNASGCKVRYLCANHAKEPLGGTTPTFTKRVRKLEKLEAAFVQKGCRCLRSECNSHAVADTFFCQTHTGKVPRSPVPASLYNATTIKAMILLPSAELPPEYKWYDQIPYDTRDWAIRSFASDMASFFELRRVKPEAAQTPTFKSRKDPTQRFHIDHRAIKYSSSGLTIFPSLKLGTIAFGKRGSAKARATLLKWKESALSAAQVIRDSTGRYYVVQPYNTTAVEPNELWMTQPYGDVFLDPGGRTFNTFYCPDGLAGKLGDGFYDDVKGCLRKADKAASDQATAKKALNEHGGRQLRRRWKRVRAKAQALRTKVHDTVRDLHRKSARFLCANFRAIHVTPFTGASVSSVAGRTIFNDSVRNLMTFAHGEFREFLKQYARPRGVHVYVVSEAYTTKTCTSCGDVRERGSVKTISCPACGTTYDRDIGAARNTGLRTATCI